MFGNHDYYMISNWQMKKYKRTSYNRVEEMKMLYKRLPNVHVLEGNTVEIEGFTIGGCGMWYDFSYGQQEQDLTEEEVYRLWWKHSNDSKLIKGVTDPLEIFRAEYERLERLIPVSDVIVTHVGPDWRLYPADEEFIKHYNYYFFDGSPFFEKLQGKTWLFGHVHYELDQIKYGCRFISQAIGYPSEKELSKKIKTITL